MAARLRERNRALREALEADHFGQHAWRAGCETGALLAQEDP